MKIVDLVDACKNADFSDMVVIHETRGEPDALIVSHFPYGPTAYFSLSSVVMRHDIEDRGTISEVSDFGFAFKGCVSKVSGRPAQ
jgi:U3 small nucleolar ribonucleoprotein protein IMP4